MNPSSSSLDAQGVIGHYDRVRNFIRQSVNNDQDAADLTQETYRRFFASERRTPVRNGEGLLFRIARNLITDRFRRQKTRPEELVEPGKIAVDPSLASQVEPFRVVEARERVRTVEAAILALPERCREVFILNRFGGLSYAQIARRLGISQGTVEKHMSRAILACRQADGE